MFTLGNGDFSSSSADINNFFLIFRGTLLRRGVSVSAVDRFESREESSNNQKHISLNFSLTKMTFFGSDTTAIF